jgi:hypothetical protein
MPTMKTMRLAIVSACALAALSIPALGAQRSVQDWKAEAMKKYPKLAIQGSALNKAFLAEYERWKQAGDKRLQTADWPMAIANLLEFERLQKAQAAKDFKLTAQEQNLLTVC